MSHGTTCFFGTKERIGEKHFTQESSGVTCSECALYHPRTKLVEIILLWVLTATRMWTAIFYGNS